MAGEPTASGYEITFLNGGSIVAQKFNEISSSSVPNLTIEGYVLKGREVSYIGGLASVFMKDGTSINSGDDSLKVGMIINNSLVDRYTTTAGDFMLSAHFEEESNPTISQVHIDGVTYDLRDRNAGEGVTTEEKAKLAALPEAAEIPSDIGPRSEVVEEVPSEYVAGKVYFVVEGDKLMDKTELESLGSYEAVVQQLNTDPQGYYDFINAGTPEGLKFDSPSYEYIVVNESGNRWDAFNKNYYWNSNIGRFNYDRSQPT